jgi:hypothetical protein
MDGYRFFGSPRVSRGARECTGNLTREGPVNVALDIDV